MANSDCIFCKIAAGEIPAKIAYEDSDVLAFHDIQPAAPVHVVVIPRRHIPSLNAISSEDAGLLGHMLEVCKQVAADLNVEEGYRVVNNCGAGAGQTVQHIHFHVLGGRELGWPPG